MRYLPVAIILSLTVSACTETTSRGPSTAMPVVSPPVAAPATAAAPAARAAAPLRTGSAANERACEAELRRQTKNPQIVTLSSDESQAATEVIIGVGPQRAKWRCLVSRGKVSEVMSLTDEGAL